MKPVRIIWLTDLPLRNSSLYECSPGFRYKDETMDPWPPEDQQPPAPGRAAYSIKNIPEYMEVRFHEQQGYALRTYRTVSSYAIDMKDYANADSYMLQHLGKKVRGNILRSVRRLEKCFDINYTVYHGSISQEEYNALVNRLREMIIVRFKERKQQSNTLKSWDKITSGLFELINDRKASIFVISHDKIPICISVGYDMGKLFFYYITSYDTDYSKFSLGHVMLYKQLEWCFNKGFRYFEMGWGDLEYKRRWSNYQYRLLNHEYYPENSFSGKIYAFIEVCKSRFFAYLIFKKVNVPFRKFKQMVRTLSEKKEAVYITSAEDRERGRCMETGMPIDPASQHYKFLKPFLNEFLYATEEKYAATGIYRLNARTFVLQGSKFYQKVHTRS